MLQWRIFWLNSTLFHFNKNEVDKKSMNLSHGLFRLNPKTETGIGLDQTPIIPGIFGTFAKEVELIM